MTALSLNIQTIAVFVILAGALIYAFWQIGKLFKARKKKKVCDNCPASDCSIHEK